MKKQQVELCTTNLVKLEQVIVHVTSSGGENISDRLLLLRHCCQVLSHIYLHLQSPKL